MNWKKEAENDLRNYTRRVESLAATKEKIEALSDQMHAIKAGLSDSTPVIGSGNRAQENIINCIAEIERLQLTQKAVERLIALVEKGLKSLTEEEYKVLDLFYIHRVKGHVEQLSEMFHLEQAQIYRIKDAALYKFTTAIYGLTEY